MEIDSQVLSEILKIGRAAGAAPTPAAGITEVMLVPQGWTVAPLEPIINGFLPAPRRAKAQVNAHDVATFVAYWKRYASENTSIMFADTTTQNVIAVIDYHKAGGDAGWRQHTVTFSLMPTVEWATWLADNGKRKTQEGFAQFIEDNAPDVVNSAALLDLALRLEATKGVYFVSGKRLSDGWTTLTYQEESAATVGKDKLVVPEEFKLRLVPYQGVEIAEVTARLRYRIQEQKLVLWYDLLRPHKVTEQAFNDAVAAIAAGTGAAVLLGKAA
jgi:uncharacterized protein YfdQ (DUF2303 family)